MKSRFLLLFLFPLLASAQLKWENQDASYGPLPKGVHVFFTEQKIDTAPFRAFYLIADLKNKKFDFTVDTTYQRRLTPTDFYEKNNKPLVVVNCTFFSFETNQNLNLVMKDGHLVSYNVHSLPSRGKDTLTYRHAYASAMGISKKRKADVAWTIADTTLPFPYAIQTPKNFFRDSVKDVHAAELINHEVKNTSDKLMFRPWKMKTATGGGPVLLQNGEIRITNNEEIKFAGNAIHDKHPRTAMGYTKDDQLIILVIEGRNPAAGGATLVQEAQILKDLGCIEALNLDGGGSSCLLVNGKETISPSDKKQRAVPAVFMIRSKK